MDVRVGRGMLVMPLAPRRRLRAAKKSPVRTSLGSVWPGRVAAAGRQASQQRRASSEKSPVVPPSFWLTPDALAALLSAGDFARLAAVLAEAPGALPDDVAVEVLASRQALIAHLEGSQLSTMFHLSRNYRHDRKYLAEEVALALGIGPSTVGARIELGTALNDSLTSTKEALATGRIGLAKARTIFDAVKVADQGIVGAYEQLVLPDADTATLPTLRQRCQQAVIALDPEGAAERHRGAVKDRNVRVSSMNDGMSQLSVFAAAQDIATIFEACRAMAGKSSSFDDRSVGARTVDVMVDVFASVLATGQFTHERLRAPRPAVGEPATSGAGRSTGDPAGNFDGNGEGAPEGSPFAKDAETAENSDEATDSGSGSRVSGPPWDLPEGVYRRGDPLPTQQGHRPQVLVVVGLDTLIGLDDAAGYVYGHGPITATQSRAIALGGDLRRLVVDPLTDRVLDLGRTVYHPPQSLVDFVCARDGICQFPGCRQPAMRCELDHEDPYLPGEEAGGATSAANLRALCARHHHLRHTPGWSVETGPDRSTNVRTPLGRSHHQDAPTPFPDLLRHPERFRSTMPDLAPDLTASEGDAGNLQPETGWPLTGEARFELTIPLNRGPSDAWGFLVAETYFTYRSDADEDEHVDRNEQPVGDQIPDRDQEPAGRDVERRQRGIKGAVRPIGARGRSAAEFTSSLWLAGHRSARSSKRRHRNDDTGGCIEWYDTRCDYLPRLVGRPRHANPPLDTECAKDGATRPGSPTVTSDLRPEPGRRVQKPVPAKPVGSNTCATASNGYPEDPPF